MDIFKTDIVPVRPFNFGLSLAYLRTSPSAVLEDIREIEYTRALSIHGTDVIVRITHDGPVDQTTLHVQLTGQTITNQVAEAAISTVRRIFTLDVDPLPFHNLYAHDPYLVASCSAIEGCARRLSPIHTKPYCGQSSANK